MDSDLPPSPTMSSNSGPQKHHPPPATTVISPPPTSNNIMQPSSSSSSIPNYHHHRTASFDNQQPKKPRDGYWKMKEAEAQAHAQANMHVHPQDGRAVVDGIHENGNGGQSTGTGLQTPLPTVAGLPASSSASSSQPPNDSIVVAVGTDSSSAPATSSTSKPRKKKASPPPLMTTKGISLVFRMPPGANTANNPTNRVSAADSNAIASSSTRRIQDESRASTPDSSSNFASGTEGADGGKKRKVENPLNHSRPTRARRSSPRGSRTSLNGSPAPGPSGALSIFAPPPPSHHLPEALQSAFGFPSVLAVDPDSAPAVDADAIRREAAAGFESRLRSRGQRRGGGERTGVSASGKDVRVGGTARTAAQSQAQPTATASSKKKGKGKADVEIPNQDFCSACRGIGRFLCCDGCPRSFHFMCLEPPLRIDELPDEETWYCKKCRAERMKQDGESNSPTKEKELKPIPSVFKKLSKKVEEENPVQFRLPTDIRQYFTGVSTAARGEYVDAEEARMKYDRKGFQEERDPLRTRDGKSRPILCYVCGGSSLPLHTLTSDPESTWRQIVSCDYCNLSWHLDCLDPPLAVMPNSGRKWMCPNHAEQALPRRRTVRNNMEMVDIETQHQPNNGNIIVVPEPEPPKGPPLPYEDLVINRKKFRVPEKIIRLDFWEKVTQKGGSIRSSVVPDGVIDNAVPSEPSNEEIEAANLVLSLLQPQSAGTDTGVGAENDAGPGIEQPRSSAPAEFIRVDSPSARSVRAHRRTRSAASQPDSVNSNPLSMPNSPTNLPQVQGQQGGFNFHSSGAAAADANKSNLNNKPLSASSQHNGSDGGQVAKQPKIVLRMPGSHAHGPTINGR